MTRAFIDLRKNGAPTPMLAAHVVERARRHSPPLLLLVAADHADAWRAVVDEQAQVWAEGTEQPPAPAPPPPAPVDLDAARAARKAALRDEIWDAVESAGLDQREIAALQATAVQVLRAQAAGVTVDPWADLALSATLGWALAELAAFPVLAAIVDAAQTVEAVDAVRWPGFSSPPPGVTAAALAVALLGGAP